MVGRSLVLVVLALTGALAGIVVVGLLRTTGPHDPVVSLEELREREVIYLEEQEIFVVYHEGEPIALSADAQHIGDKVEFCETSRLFESEAHGEKFDIRGIYFGGPARRSLDRYRVVVQGDRVTIDISEEIEGLARNKERALEPAGELCVPT
ncbi:MAG: Rieske (2Fe-2S) protein [Actinomycetota bacterium]